MARELHYVALMRLRVWYRVELGQESSIDCRANTSILTFPALFAVGAPRLRIGHYRDLGDLFGVRIRRNLCRASFGYHGPTSLKAFRNFVMAITYRSVVPNDVQRF